MNKGRFPSLAPKHEPDLETYLGISLDGVGSYSDLLQVLRNKGIRFDEGIEDEGILPEPMICSLSPGSYSSVGTLAFQYDSVAGTFARYKVFLDENQRILCIENNYGYRNPL